MKCPKCEVDGKSLVIETRKWDDAIWRRRACGGCGRNYVTREEPAASMPDYRPDRDQSKPKSGVFTTDHLKGLWR